MLEITHFDPLVREPSSHISITWVSWSRETIRNLVFSPKLSCWIHLSKRNHAMTPNMFWLILCVFIIPHRWKSLSMNGFLQDHHIFVTVTNWAQHSKATSAFAMEPMGFLFMASCTRVSAKRWCPVVLGGWSLETDRHEVLHCFWQVLGKSITWPLDWKIWRSHRDRGLFSKKTCCTFKAIENPPSWSYTLPWWPGKKTSIPSCIYIIYITTVYQS